MIVVMVRKDFRVLDVGEKGDASHCLPLRLDKDVCPRYTYYCYNIITQ
jgi:hypothetical protein